MQRNVMQLTKVLLVTWLLIPKIYLTGMIIEAPKPDNSSYFIDAAIRVVKTCYGDQVSTVGLAGPSTGILAEKLWSQEYLTVTLIDNTARIVNNGRMSRDAPYKLNFFVITASSWSVLERIIKEVKDSLWWNHLASFLILEWPASIHDCSNAYEILSSAWKMNLLHAKLMCLERTKIRVYGFNPYTSNAPQPWKIERIYEKKHENSWTLFGRPYEENKEICEKLDFDKTKDLGGYKIRSVATDTVGHWTTDFYKTGRDHRGGIHGIVMHNVFSALNATPIILVHSNIKSFGYVDTNGQPHGALLEVINGTREVNLNGLYQLHLLNYATTYPHWESGLAAMTQHRPGTSQVSKLMRVMDLPSRMTEYLVYLVTIIVLHFFLKEPLILSVMIIFRAVLNVSLNKVPKRFASRILIGSLFLLTMHITAFEIGRMSSLITTQESFGNVETFQDLIDLDYKVYTNKRYLRFFSNVKSFIGLKGFQCSKYALNDASAACVLERSTLINDAVKYKLHISSNPVVKLHATFVIQPDWPLEKRVNIILRRLTEAHLICFWYEELNRKQSQILEWNENEGNERTFKVITLQQMNFIFIMLIAGLGFATVSFIIEIKVGRRRSINANMRGHIGSRRR